MPIGQHINTFEKGMFSDTNIVLQPDGTYRFMKNCQLINQDNNNYVVKDCQGNLVTFQINPIYDAVYTTVNDDYPMPVGFISFPDKLIVFSTNSNTSTGGYGEIGVLNYVPYGNGIQPKSVSGEYNAGYVPLYHHVSLNFSWMYRLEGFGFTENELIERVYWTDNFNEPRVFNTSDPIFTNYIANGSLVNGESYMVLEGAVTHNSTDYGPGLTDGNVFIASSANYTNLTGASPTPKVVKYYPVELLNFTPSRALGNIKFDEYGSGNLTCGSKIYYYRLLSDGGMPPTSWSYGSYPVPVGTQNYYISGNTYHDFVGGGTTLSTLNSKLSVKIVISDIDTNFDYIEVACSEFDQLIDVPRQTTIIANLPITSSTMTIEHTGNVNLGSLTYPTDFTTFPAYVLKCKTMATSKNYILVGNMEEREDLDWDLSGITIGQFEYPMNVHYDADSCSLSGMVYSGISPSTGVNPTSGNIRPWERYAIISGGSITYDGDTYSVGEVFVGVVGVTTYAVASGAPVIRPCVTRNRYTDNSSSRREDYIELVNNGSFSNDCFWDYRSAAAHHHCAGYWSGETYKLGILPFDKKGRPYPVIPIGTYQFDDVNAKGGVIRSDAFGADLIYSLTPSGLKIDNVVITEASGIASKISGFSIVRAVRDPRIVMQGLVTQNTSNGATPAVYRPGAWIPVSLDGNATVAPATYTGIFPDVLVDCPMKDSVGQIGDIMESAFWIDPYDYSAGVRVRGSGPVASEQVYSKIITPLSADTTLRSQYITLWQEVNEDDVIDKDANGNSIIGNGITFTNSITTAAASVNVEGACVTGAADYTLNSHEAVGGKKIYFELNADFLHYGPSANGYSSTAAAAETEKMVMNYVKSGKTEFYQGNEGDIYYVSTGHFQPVNDAILDTVDNGAGSYIFTDIEVFGGDCFTCLVDYGYGLWNSDDANKYSYAWTFPCECNSNYNLRRGRKTSNVEMWYTGIAATSDAIVFKNSSTIHLEDYSYNQGYSTENFAVAYLALPENFVNPTQFEFRIRFAGEKVIGETYDSFRTFLVNDYKDIDGSAGRINNIRVKDGRVIVWQDKMVTTVPVLERQLLAAPAGDPTTIGTGGVVDRFDPLNSYFGNQHQWGLTETEFGWLWFDMRRKSVLEMRSSGGILEVSQIFGLQNLFNEAFVEVVGDELIDEDTLLNSPTFSSTGDRPLMGIGITGVFDPKIKMTYLTFKFKARKVVDGNDSYKSMDFTIGFLHSNTDTMFVGFFDWFPAIAHRHDQIVLSASNPKNTTQFLENPLTIIIPPNSFNVGETLQGYTSAGATNNVQYVCIQDVDLDNAAKFPLGASGATYWAPVFQTNYLHVLNQPSALGEATAPDYGFNKFDGLAVDNQIDIVVNPGQGTIGSFYVGSYKQVGPYNVNYTTITVSAVDQSGQDTNIRSTDRNYRFVYDGIESNSPLTSKGARVINKFNLFQFYKKNWTSDPRIVTGSVKILEKLISRITRKF